MRKQFRRNVSVGAREVEGGRAPQLYAGKPMFSDTTVRETDGDAGWGTRKGRGNQ